MHSLVIALGVVIVLMIIIHILFRVVKFTFSVFLLGIALIGTEYIFERYFGVDLIALIARHL